MRRIIVHAGLHKTGTTSLQTFLSLNAAALAPHVHIAMREALGPAFHAGRLYGYHRQLWLFRRAVRAFALSLPKDNRPVFISREGFSGLMPGFSRLGRWGAPVASYRPDALRLARVLVQELAALGQVELLYTTRAPEAWARSVWAHLLRDTKLALDLPDFAARLDADLDAQASEIARALPGTPVHIRALETASGPLGPGAFVTDLLDLPKPLCDALIPPPRRHQGPDMAVAEQLLALNRAGATAARKAETLKKVPAK